jgi:spore maturation protein CgeB
MKKIDLLVGDNDYGTTLHFSKGLADALNKMGIQTRLFWVGEGHFFHAFYTICQDPPDLTCSFSDISLNRTPLGDLWHIPHLSLLVDPPIYSLHHCTGKYGWVSCVDEDDCVFLRAAGFPQVFFLPHAADCKWQTSVKKERPFEAVFFGTCLDYEEIALKWPKKEKELLLAASEKVLTPNGPSIVQALAELGVKEYDLPRLHNEVDAYTRGKERIQLIRSLHSQKVHIWGNGVWKKYFPELEVHPPATFEDVLLLMQQSKLVLNSSPRFKAGAHERIFYALMCGASVYTAENRYLKVQLPEIFTCRLGEWEAPSFKEWDGRAEIGQTTILRAHTWEIRAHTLVNSLVNC